MVDREPEWVGWVISIAVPKEASDAEVERFFEVVADAVHGFEERSGWDPHMVVARHDTLAVQCGRELP